MQSVVQKNYKRKNGVCDRRHAITARNETSILIHWVCEFIGSHTIHSPIINIMQSSPLLEHLIENLRCLPGVGPKSAQRMAYHLYSAIVAVG